MSQTSSEPGAPPRRHAARVLLLDDADRVLLFEGIDPWVPDVRFWFTPGGGVEDGESLEEAAAREQRAVLGHRWWTPAELAATDATVYPTGLPRHLAELLRAGPPAEPVDMGR